jgi:hypothetical protein
VIEVVDLPLLMPVVVLPPGPDNCDVAVMSDPVEMTVVLLAQEVPAVIDLESLRGPPVDPETLDPGDLLGIYNLTKVI